MLFGQLLDGLLQMVTLLPLILQGLLPPSAVRFCYIEKVTTSLKCEHNAQLNKRAETPSRVPFVKRLDRSGPCGALTLIIALEVIRKRVARSLTALTRSVPSADPRSSSSSLRERWRAAPCFPISSLQVLRSSSLLARVLSTPWVRARSS